MPRRVQDIVPGDRRSIRNITLERKTSSDKETSVKKTRANTVRESVRRDTAKESADDAGEPRITKETSTRKIPITPPPIMEKPPVKRSGRGGALILTVVLVILLVAGAGYAASSFFSHATFIIVPKTFQMNINGTYIAQSSGGELDYKLMNLEESASTTAVATNGPQTTVRAQGNVTLYNNHSTSAERLIAGTRISGESGRIYRLKNSVTIPGKSGSNPGTLITPVVADQAGEEYNVTAPEDFKIVGFKGTARYATVYARLNTGEINGGFSGTRKVIAPALLASTTEQLRMKIAESLILRARNDLPEGHIMYDGAQVISFSTPVVGGSDDDSRATVSLTGTLTGIFFEKGQLVDRLSKGQAAEVFGSFPYTAIGLDQLEVNIANAKDFSPQKKNSLILRMTGGVKLVADIPVDELKYALAGLSLGETERVFKPYESIITKGSGELIPPWTRVPSDLKRISLQIREE